MSELADVVVIGGGVAGTIAAIECAKLGLDVCLISDGSSAIRSVQLADVAGIDVAAETFSPEGPIDRLRTELGFEAETLLPRNTILDTGRVAAELPANVLAGIPGNPFAPDLAPFVPGARIRAYADRVMPFLKVGEAHQLAALVRQRLGQKLLDGFTDPYCRAVYGVPAEQVDLQRAAPKFNSTLTSLGTLSGAALALTANDATQLRLAGGLAKLMTAVSTRAENYAVRMVPARATTLARSENHWIVGTDSGVFRGRTVIGAVDPAGLGWDRLPGVTETATEVHVTNALVSVASVSAHTGLLCSEDPELLSAARPGARSQLLADAIGPGRDLIRTVGRTPADPIQSVREAATRMGVDVTELIAADSASWTVFRPWVRAEDPLPGGVLADDTETLEWTGQWTAGSGLDRVATHAHEVAHRMRTRAVTLRLATSA